ncbi:YceI family protein [Aquimarina sp. SS2-1]|uniref:YceI family protein n=1 Tax=Aquimarina besae TaxID=3342247 RepID=UPI00366B2566
MKTLRNTLFLLLISSAMMAQEKFITKSGYTSFYSKAPLEDIQADNNQVLSIMDTSTGAIAISILMKSFLFEKSLMQEHFNENYVESDKYPKATFKGNVLGFENVGTEKSKVSVIGNITIHGVTKPLTMEATMQQKDSAILLEGSFPLTIADFNIEIPDLVINNIAKEVKVSFEYNHQPYNK